jgi:hypothetical protein
MGRKCASCEKDLHLVEDLIKGYCTECVKTGKAKGEAKDLENVELKEQIARLLKQPRVIELINRLKCLGEAVE